MPVVFIAVLDVRQHDLIDGHPWSGLARGGSPTASFPVREDAGIFDAALRAVVNSEQNITAIADAVWKGHDGLTGLFVEAVRRN
jgi:hypothetical protein